MHPQRHRLLWQLLSVCLIAGCQDSVDVRPVVENGSPSVITREPITNRFGMTFSFVEVTRSAAYKNTSFPRESYYLQQATLTYEQFAEYQKVSGTEVRFPTEWRECDYLARALSELDSDYDYRIPSRSEWTFACMNGDQQTCPHSNVDPHDPSAEARPNRFDIRGFLDGNLECVTPAGTFMGMGEPSRFGDSPLSDCICEQSTVGNPDADDGLNELIVARFVLIPK